MTEEIGIFQGKTYRAVEYVKNSSGASACDYCAFQLGKCRGAIWSLGQCFVLNGEEIIKNIYYEELTNN